MLPRHIAIIMDGNGRWAQSRRLPRVAGHRVGMETLRKIVIYAGNIGIEWLTLYAFSSENWSRPDDEVSGIFSLLKLFVQRDLDELKKNGVRVRFIGERKYLSSDLVSLLEEIEKRTEKNNDLKLVIAFNYGSRNEIVRTVRCLVTQAIKGILNEDDINEVFFSSHLDTASIPDPDLIIRTSGEMRLSNFLLWQAAYSEFSFVPCYWPDFSVDKFDAVLNDFCNRERRFGNLKRKHN